MRFDAQDGSVFLLHYEVLDANGVVIPRAISGDMDTGLVKRAEVGPNGELIRQGNKIKTLVERHPAPLYLRKVRKSVQETSQQFDWQPFIDNQFMWTEKSDEDTKEADTQPSNSSTGFFLAIKNLSTDPVSSQSSLKSDRKSVL